MRRPSLWIATVLAGLMICGAAQAQTACETYRVKRGDTLRDIAEAVLGRDDFRSVWRANRTLIGRNPNLIREGMVLRMPCPEGQPTKTAPAPAPSSGLSLVTASGYLPYTDEAAAGGGLVTRLVETALLRARPDEDIEIAFVDDWSAHFDYLLPRETFDASFPWVRPDCTGRSADAFCTDVVWSDPVYEIVEGFFSRADEGFHTALDHDGLSGARICRPDGYPVWHLVEAGLVDNAEALVRAPDAKGCFERLAKGETDIVAIDTRTGDLSLTAMGIEDQIVANPHLVTIEALRVALPANGAKTEALRLALNEGLSTMLQSGEWDAIVSDALGAGAGLARY